MKLKQHFPIIVLSVLSVLSLVLMVTLPLINFFKLGLQTITPSLQNKIIIQTLANGSLKAALILVFVWMGMGINNMLSRIQDSAKRRLITNSVVLGSLFLCVALPTIGIILTDKVLSSKERWQQFPDPPETATAIAGGAYNTVIIETENGNYFSCGISNVATCWQPEDQPDASMLPGSSESDPPNIQTPGKSISIIGVPSYPGSMNQIYYTVLEDHTVWYLAETGEGFLAAALLATLMFPIMLGSLLILLGMALTAFLRWLADQIWRKPQAE